ncbi:unnamed protein product [Toxocara canis]|uniref:Uncharacterized protein n=1 Tax=Toxocara canis TaxID=6265 RepID=A0A183TWJ3_TOXCA|nr:unnamed protein product [Toxocara canis]
MSQPLLAHGESFESNSNTDSRGLIAATLSPSYADAVEHLGNPQKFHSGFGGINFEKCGNMALKQRHVERQSSADNAAVKNRCEPSAPETLHTFASFAEVPPQQ